MAYEFQNIEFPSLLLSTSSSEKEQYEVVIQNKKKNFNCLVPGCGKTFHFKSEIKRHLVIHSNQRPFVCDFPHCGKSFKRADALSNHSRLHGTNDPYHCPVPDCLSKFNTKAGLQYHLLKHSDEKIFKCKYPGCDKSFVTYAQLKQHQKSSFCHKKLIDTNEVHQEELVSTSDEMLFFEEDNNSMNFAAYDESRVFDFESEVNSENYQENFNQYNQGKLSGWEFASNPSQDIQEEISINSAPASNDFPVINKDNNLMEMLSTILKENRKLKEQLQQVSDLLIKSPQKSQEVENIDNTETDKFFSFSYGLSLENWRQDSFRSSFYAN